LTIVKKKKYFKKKIKIIINYQYAGDNRCPERCPFMTLQYLATIMPIFIPLVISEAKDTKYIQKKNSEHVKLISEILEHLKLP